MTLHTNIKALSLMVSDKKIFHVFPYISLCLTCDPYMVHGSSYISLCETCDPWGGVIFAPGALFEQTW